MSEFPFPETRAPSPDHVLSECIVLALQFESLAKSQASELNGTVERQMFLRSREGHGAGRKEEKGGGGLR